jgi:cytidylate kinase
MPAHAPAGAPFSGVVAIDGPSGTGKSTVSKLLAGRLGARYLDTGAMYRAATVAVAWAGVDPDDAPAVIDVVRRMRLGVSTDPANQATTLDGRRVDAEIRSAATTAAVSAVSAVPEVREALVALQRRLIAGAGIVVEGRDIGSVVWPQADLKLYLTASEDVRAERRSLELGSGDVRAVASDLARRDGLDSGRAVSPLRRADGAREVDTSLLDVAAVVELLERLAREAVSVGSGA